METIINWLTNYSLPIVFLIILGAIFIYLIKMVTEKTISNQFDKHKKILELDLARRSNFEERILLDRYVLIQEIQTKIENISTNLNRVKNGAKIDGFIVNNDLVPLTEIYELLSTKRFMLTNKFYDLFISQANLILNLSNEKDSHKQKEIGDKYLKLKDQFYNEMIKMFDIDNIKW